MKNRWISLQVAALALSIGAALTGAQEPQGATPNLQSSHPTKRVAHRTGSAATTKKRALHSKTVAKKGVAKRGTSTVASKKHVARSSVRPTTRTQARTHSSVVSKNKAVTTTAPKPAKLTPAKLSSTKLSSAKLSPAKVSTDKPSVEEPTQKPIEPSVAREHQAATNDPLARLTVPLRSQGLLPADIELKDACTHFQTLSDCIAALHASHNLGINFNCMKWDLTGVPLTADPESCATPGSRNLMTLSKAIQALKPDSFGIEEAINAQKQADNDLKAAGLDSLSKGGPR